MTTYIAREQHIIAIEPGPEPVGEAQAYAMDNIFGRVAWGAGGNRPGWGLQYFTHADLPPLQDWSPLIVRQRAHGSEAEGFEQALPNTVAPKLHAEGERESRTVRERLLKAGI
jgi:hypothetical protein